MPESSASNGLNPQSTVAPTHGDNENALRLTNVEKQVSSLNVGVTEIKGQMKNVNQAINDLRVDGTALKTKTDALENGFKAKAEVWEQSLKTKTEIWDQSFKAKTDVLEHGLKTKAEILEQSFKASIKGLEERLDTFKLYAFAGFIGLVVVFFIALMGAAKR